MNAEKRIVLVIDMQNDFITGTLGTAEARRIVPVVAARIEAERAAGAMLVFTRDTHGNDYMQSLEGKLLPVAHCEQGSAGWALAPEIAPLAEGARIIDKPTFGCVALPELLRPHGIPAYGPLHGHLRGVERTPFAGLFPGKSHLHRAGLLRGRHA